MVVDETSLPKMKKPGRLKLGYLYFLTISMYVLFRIFKSNTENENFRYNRAVPNANDVIS